MTLRLSSTENTGIKSYWDGTIGIGEWRSPEHIMSMGDFCAAAQYVLTNTDLVPNDPRLDFIRWVRELQIGDGWNVARQPDSKRLIHVGVIVKDQESEILPPNEPERTTN